MLILSAVMGVLTDCLIGDPKTKYHPVALIGKYIAILAKIMRNAAQSPKKQIWAGAGLVGIVLGTVYGIVFVIAKFVSTGEVWLIISVNAVLLSFTISPRSLAEAGIEIRNFLQQNNLVAARQKVGWIVGRDTDKLSAPEVTRATVETIAENIVDGITAPLFYFFIGGAPLAFLYRAVNTLDSMIAYKNAKYLYFGKVAARTDDCFNYIPARLTAASILVAAVLLRLDYKQAWRMIRRDAAKHPSPNSGFTEAAVAGALGVQLGGMNYYFGIAALRARLGDSQHTLNPNHITKTIQIMYGTTVLFLFLAILLAWALGRGL